MGKMCPNCGNILSDQAKFCPKCGTKQETQTRQEGKFCLFCGATLEPGARFCSSCGRDLMAAKKGNGGAVHSTQSYASAKGETQENWRQSVFGRFGARKSLTSPDAPHIIRRKGDERKSTCAGSEREGAPPAESAPREAQREVHPRASGLRRQLRL